MKSEILTSDMRNSLKQIIQEEINQLPERLKELEVKDRISVVCKLMPYVFPKVESVHSTEGEPMNWNV